MIGETCSYYSFDVGVTLALMCFTFMVAWFGRSAWNKITSKEIEE